MVWIAEEDSSMAMGLCRGHKRVVKRQAWGARVELVVKRLW